MNDLLELLSIAGKTARAAGDTLRKSTDAQRTVHFEDAKDVKLKADLDTEALIRQMLQAAAPLPVIGEEQGGDATLTSRYEPYWVIDPLDGTFNYQRGVPLTCVSIGLMRGETPVLGAIYDFNRDELFTGLAGHGYFINGKATKPRWAATTALASLQTGFPTGRDFSDAALKEFVGKIQGFQKIRAIGSAALSLAWVSCGRFDVYFEEGIRLWDVAAGLALVQAAGGVVKMAPSKTGKFLAYDVWAAGNPALL
ncbi:MAG: inositol monophosphatase family protein [Verrucomicrobiota bacterium]|nr:inositol monophosphatase family protein [Verrucomicrobiota bacterium]